MKSICRVAVSGALFTFAGVAAASSGSLDQSRPKVLPVLVQVNSHGQVTDASPSIELSPAVTRLLRTNLDEMIAKPATDKDGHPMSSQFIINLAVQAAPIGNDKFATHFSYVSTSPVPAGSWYWVHIDGHRLALARQGSFRPHQRMRYEYDRQPSYQPSRGPAATAATPATSSANQSTPAPAPNPAHGK